MVNFKKDPDLIPILLCFDANYVNYAAVATYSAYKNTQSPLIFYWLSTMDSKERAEKLKKHLQQFGVKIELLVSDLADINDWKAGYHFTSANYLRLLAPDLILDADKAIYLDCDTLVLADLNDLYNHRLGDAYFAGVVDEVGGQTSKVPRDIKDRYINTGVLLMDLKGLREDEFLKRSKALYKQYQSQITWVDQCLINKYAEGRKVILEPKWNRLIFPQNIKETEFTGLANPQVSSILHFHGGTKPWQKWCNPLIAKFWWSYAEDLQFNDLKPTPIRSFKRLISLGKVLHRNCNGNDARVGTKQALLALLKHFVNLH